jgi:hypothetical protein
MSSVVGLQSSGKTWPQITLMNTDEGLAVSYQLSAFSYQLSALTSPLPSSRSEGSMSFAVS